MKRSLLLLICMGMLVTFYSCAPTSVDPQESLDYFPLQVGNYWKINANDYLEITNIKKIGDDEYFEITSTSTLGTSVIYIRIDENLNLIRTNPDKSYTQILANLGMKKGQKLKNTLEEGTVIERNTNKLVFRYKCLPCSQANATYEVAFHKNKGILSRNVLFGGYISGNPSFKEIRVNGKVSHL